MNLFDCTVFGRTSEANKGKPTVYAFFMEKIHIGNIVIQKLRAKDFTIAWLARQVNCDESNFYKKLKNNNLDPDLIFFISEILHDDLFAVYSQKLQEKMAKSTI